MLGSSFPHVKSLLIQANRPRGSPKIIKLYYERSLRANNVTPCRHIKLHATDEVGGGGGGGGGGIGGGMLVTS